MMTLNGRKVSAARVPLPISKHSVNKNYISVDKNKCLGNFNKAQNKKENISHKNV